MSNKQESENSMQAAKRSLVLPLLVLFLAASFTLTPAYGQSISISGTVKDADGKALAGAEVYSVADPKLKTVSAADGSFTLAGAIADATTQPASAPQSAPAEKPKPVTRTPIAAAKAGYMTAQVLSPALSAKDMQFKLYPAIVGTTVTLLGNRMGPSHMREEAQWDNKTGKPGVTFMFMMAFDGPPGIKAEFDQILNDYYPGPNLDGDAAKEVEDQFKSRLLFYIEGPLVDAKTLKEDNYGPGHPLSVTGTIQEKDGKKYITATEWGKYNGPKYPDRIMGVTKPLVQLPVKPGLTVKLTDKLTDTLIYVPAGKFYMGCPLEQATHWQEAPQHMVTFTKGFYLADHPILNSEYAAVTGDTTRNPKNYPDGAAANMSCEMFDTYVKALEKLNPGKVIRCPSKAEWEYVARCGASNISVRNNPGDMYGQTCDRTMDVKSRKPNSWGFYGIMFADGSERSCDAGFFSDHVFIPSVTDPRYPVAKCKANPASAHIHANGGKDDHPIQELLNDNNNVGRDLGGEQRNGYLLIRQRVLIEE